MSDTNVPAGSPSAQDTGSVSQSEVDVLNEGTGSESDETVVSDEGEGETSEAEIPSEEEEETAEPETEEEVSEELEEEEELSSTEEPTRPSWQTIKEKYPELAKNKDFRELYFRDKAYTEIYPTVGDAQEAANKAEQLDALDTTLVSGDVDTIFGNINPEVLMKISDRLLPALYKHNQQAFARAARPLLIDVMNTVVSKADREGDDNLKKSVRNVFRALTGSPEIPSRVPITEQDPTVVAERNRLQQERQNLFATQERGFLKNADNAVMRKLESMVSEGLDPKGEFNSFTRQAIIEKTLNDLQRVMLSDSNLAAKLKHLHKLAQRSGFPDEYRARIVSASLERAKRLIPMLRNKHRMAALGKQSTKGENGSKKIVTKNETVSSGEKAGNSISRGKIDTRKTSAEDFLNDRVTYRK